MLEERGSPSLSSKDYYTYKNKLEREVFEMGLHHLLFLFIIIHLSFFFFSLSQTIVCCEWGM